MAVIRRLRRGRTPVVDQLVDSSTTATASATVSGTLDRWFAAQGTPLRYDLARSGAASMSLGALLALIELPLDEVLATSLDYGPGRGRPRLAQAIRASVAAPADAGVVVASGAVEALLLLAAARGRGAAALVGAPSYGGLLSAPEVAGMRVVAVPVWDPVRGLHLDELAARISDTTSLVVVNTPHNPSGAVASLADLDELAGLCRRRGALLVVDEVARGTLHPGAASAVHSRGFAGGTTVVIGDVSKSLGLGGLRVGWLIAADPLLCAATAAAKDGTTVASGTLSEALATAALEQAPRLLSRVRAAARANLGALADLVDGNGDGGRWMPPADGLVAFPALSSADGIDGLVARLRDQEVGVVPGSLFGEPGRVRMGLGVAPADFGTALDRLAAALAHPGAQP